jgi:hypothetical protein
LTLVQIVGGATMADAEVRPVLVLVLYLQAGNSILLGPIERGYRLDALSRQKRLEFWVQVMLIFPLQ